MRKEKKQKSIGRLLIDLTPLLDVIFIVLIVVLAGQDNYNAEANRKIVEAEEYVNKADHELEDMKTKVDMYSEQMTAYESINEVTTFITVYSSYDLDNRKLRTVSILIDGEEPLYFSINPSNDSEIWTECKRIIEDTINKEENLMVVLSINSNNDEKMLYRDSEAIYGIFKELQNTYPGIIYIR